MRQRNNRKAVKSGKRLIVIMLSLCLVLTPRTTGIFAETTESVSENSAETADDMEITDDIYTEEVENPEAAGVITGQAESTEGEENRETVSENEMPSDPIHYCTGRGDGSDRSVYSYVYFGRYPKSMVNDRSLKMAINKAISAGNKPTTPEGIDVMLDGVWYRRIAREDCPTKTNFDEVTNDTWLYFKWEPIKWKVLQNDGETLFLMADEAIDCMEYHSAYGNANWKDCTIRSWLNGNFYQNAFNENERQAIVQQNVENSDNGGTTADKVYLLSVDDLTNRVYGFCRSSFTSSKSRQIKASDYSYVKGTRQLYIDRGCDFWARAMYKVDDYGFLSGFPDTSGTLCSGVVPAIHINLSSDLWTITEGGANDNAGDENNTNEGEDNKNGGTGTDSSKVKASSISVKGISKKIAAGKKISLSAEVLPKEATDRNVIWTSSNQKYATVDVNGVATVNKAGAGKTVTITATAKDGSGVYAQYQIKIMKHAVKKVKITAPSKNVKAGGKLKLKATVTTTGKNANKKLKWISSNESYATVSSGGVVKASKAGKGKTVTITAMATDGSGKKAKVKIKIK